MALKGQRWFAAARRGPKSHGCALDPGRHFYGKEKVPWAHPQQDVSFGGSVSTPSATMLIVKSVSGVPIRLTEERWQHIRVRHPEMQDQQERILETVAEPDLVQKGDAGELLAVRRYDRTPLTEKCLVVPYRELNEEDGFILTAYLTSQPSAWREIVWKP